MDGKNKVSQKELNIPTQISSTTQGPVSDSTKLSRNVSLPAGNSTATQTQASVGVLKKHHNVDSPSSQRHVIDLNSSQSLSHPKKKGGFVITSVKDNVDGDESPDDLDESHTSYSDLSYSKTTDVDHDQESSASEDTLHMSVQDIGDQTKNVHHNHIGNIALVSRQASGTSDQVVQPLSLQTAPQGFGSAPAVKQHTKRKQSYGLLPGSSLEFPPELPSDSSHDSNLPVTQTTIAKVPSSAGQEVSGTSVRVVASQTTSANQNQPASQTKPIASNNKTARTSSSTTSVSANSASSASSSSASVKPTSSNSAALQKGGSRVYKVVKRETGQPVRKDIGRWVCFDYGDVQTPNMGFVTPSASGSRLNFHDQMHIHSTNQIPLSMSSTSVPSSSSAYSLQHSDSASSVQRDLLPQTGSSSAVQHSTSTSSVNQEPEVRKLLKSFKKGTGSETLTGDGRLSGGSISEQELLKNVMQSSGELSINQEQDDDSGSDTASTGGIDIKIQKAMDLVKKHLMMAVRDEVDELKDKIAELTNQNETLLGMLHPEQFAALQSKHTIPANRQQLPFLVQSMQPGHQMPVYQQQHSVDQSSTATSPEHGSQPPLPHSHPTATAQPNVGKKHSLPSHPTGFSLPNQAGPLHRSQGALPFQQALSKPTSLNLAGEAAPVPIHSQQSLLAQQQVIKKQPQQHLITQQLPRSANYQPNQALHQLNLQATSQQHVVTSNLQQLQQPQGSPGLQFSSQQIQALLQLAYPQLASQFAPQLGQIPQGVQPTQGMVPQQQTGLSLPSQQAPLQVGPYQSYQQQQQTLPLQQTGQLKNANLSQVMPPTLQGQFIQSSQASVARVPVQASHSAPVFSRQPQLPAHTVLTSPTMSGPSVHPHGPLPSVHGQQQMQFTAVPPASVPTPSGTASGGTGSISTDQKPPSS